MLHSQQTLPLTIGDKVSDFEAPLILNSNVSSSTLGSLQKDITIIDFFGTWCVPCMRALPELTELQQKYPEQLRILLISIEDQAQLEKFLTKKKAGSLPLLVDNEEKISSMFQPPSYPYTVVLDKERKIIAIETSGGITEDQFQKMLSGNYSMKQTTANGVISINTTKLERSNNPLVKLSQDFIYAEKTDGDVAPLQQELTAISFDSLVHALDSDAEKKAFWINIYNGSAQALLKMDSSQYQNRNRFFKSRQINVAGQQLSLDKIEHGYLRRSSVKWSLGHLHKWFPSKTEKDLRVDKVDYRIHFALNCGAKSCPPIAFYHPESIDNQLDLATANYLRNEVIYDSAKNTVRLPAIMGWFRGDFGGKKGMYSLLKKYDLIPENRDPKIRFKKYNWDIALSNYSK